MADDLALGVYEDVVTSALEQRLAGLIDRQVDVDELPAAEAPDRLAMHLATAVRRVLDGLALDRDRSRTSAELIATLLRQLEREVSHYEAAADLPVAHPPQLLRGVFRRNPDGSRVRVDPPITPLLDTTVLTNSRGDRSMSAHLGSEIASASGVDAIVAFIRKSGIAPMMEPLSRAADRGVPLRVLTTTFTGTTDADALQQLTDAGAHVRVSYDLSSARLHAKAWMFHRPGGAGTAYLGSSNATAHGLVSGLEWNVRLSQKRNPDAVVKLHHAFDSYWESGDFVPFDRDEFDARSPGPAGAAHPLLAMEVRPFPFQERMLEDLDLAREAGHHRNLLVSATGTGKTVMAALDYQRLIAQLPSARMLFVAHRHEILDQSLATFRHVLQDGAFGEKWVGQHRPRHFTHVFASIQSLASNGLADLDPAHFDVVIVDEFHHAAAATYRGLLTKISPRELLGMTATPERTDGFNVAEFFDGRIASEMRLWDAIAEGRLVPFQYFALADGTSLVHVPWRRGRGYDIEELTNVYTSDDAWTRLVLRKLGERVDIGSMRALGFCVSVAHAQFMAHRFNEAGVVAAAVSGETPQPERDAALRRLREGDLRIVFSVDLFNEGVDLPTVDTLLLLRPTDSATLFLQQLGRGLRRAPGKDVCTVLDFVAQHNHEFRFDHKMRALVGGGTRRSLIREVEHGFPGLPPGATATLDPVAQQRILDAIRSALPSTAAQLVAALRQLIDAGHPATLASFLRESGVELEDVYRSGRSFSDLLEAAGASVETAGPHERSLRRSIGRLLHVDDHARISAWSGWLAGPKPQVSQPAEGDRRLLRMLVAQVTAGAIERSADLAAGVELLWAHRQVCSELGQLLEVLADRVPHMHPTTTGLGASPLLVHASYSRIEIQAGLGDGDRALVPTWREGVRWLPDERVDAFVVTLNKAGDQQFSPTTAYRDFAVSRSLFHWESQSTTSADSPTGRRYREHVAMGSTVLLFTRMGTDDRAFLFLGPARYQSHEATRPMQVLWRLDHPIPADVFPGYAAVGAA